MLFFRGESFCTDVEESSTTFADESSQYVNRLNQTSSTFSSFFSQNSLPAEITTENILTKFLENIIHSVTNKNYEIYFILLVLPSSNKIQFGEKLNKKFLLHHLFTSMCTDDVHRCAHTQRAEYFGTSQTLGKLYLYCS